MIDKNKKEILWTSSFLTVGFVPVEAIHQWWSLRSGAGQPFLKVVKHNDGWNLIIGFCFLTFEDGTFLRPRDAMCVYIYISTYVLSITLQ